LEQLAEERRRVLSDWRALVLLRRATLRTAPAERRWEQLPETVLDVHPILRRMRTRREIEPIRGLRQIYQVTVPYARFAPLLDEEILAEVHPYAALGHISALVFHGLTNALPQEFIVMAPTSDVAGMYPSGTTAEDWIGLALIAGQRVKEIHGRHVHWVNVKPERYFGVGQYQPFGYTILATTPERTLLDGLQAPQLSGGLENVLQAWALARDTLNVNALVQLVEQFDINLLRQRAGFLLETLGLTHAALERWQRFAGRGGSSKLLASAPYSSEFSERWNLSINVPIEVLRG
jgi:predicted transcriptional regulator of viral defense system